MLWLLNWYKAPLGRRVTFLLLWNTDLELSWYAVVLHYYTMYMYMHKHIYIYIHVCVCICLSFYTQYISLFFSRKLPRPQGRNDYIVYIEMIDQIEPLWEFLPLLSSYGRERTGGWSCVAYEKNGLFSNFIRPLSLSLFRSYFLRCTTDHHKRNQLALVKKFEESITTAQQEKQESDVIERDTHIHIMRNVSCSMMMRFLENYVGLVFQCKLYAHTVCYFYGGLFANAMKARPR